MTSTSKSPRSASRRQRWKSGLRSLVPLMAMSRYVGPSAQPSRSQCLRMASSWISIDSSRWRSDENRA